MKIHLAVHLEFMHMSVSYTSVKFLYSKNNIWTSICECTVQKFGKVNFGTGLIKKDWLRKVNFENFS